MGENSFIKCFSEDAYKKVFDQGHPFIHESNGVYWFEEDKNIMFTFSDDKDIETTNIINI